MEESQLNSSKVTVSGGNLVLFASYAALIIMHVKFKVDAAIFGLLFITLAISALRLITYWGAWSVRHVMAFTYVVGDIPRKNIEAFNPLVWPNIADTVIHLAVATYLVGLGYWPVVFFIIAPCIFSLTLYNTVVRLTSDEGIRGIASRELDLRENEYKRNIIMNEEINAVMPAVLERVNERWLEAGLLEDNNERDESGESDQGTVSTTDERDGPR